MPGGDGTGPMGTGPMTGRAAGFCAGFSVPGFANRGLGGFGGFGRGGGGWGYGRGGGRGWRNRFYATGLPGWQQAAGAMPTGAYGPAVTKQQQLDALTAQSEYLQQSLQEIQQRVQELQAASDEE